jgi:hypothetical protein
MRNAIAIVVFVFASSLAAQPLTVGTQIVDAGGTATITNGGPVTYVNLSAGATADGTVNKATVAWSATCSNAFKIVFLRETFHSVATFTLVATRGPFNAVSGRNQVTLSPPVSVNQGDFIGVVQLLPVATCGSIRTQSFPNSNGYNLVTTADMSTNGGVVGASSNYASGLSIGAIAYTTDPVLVRVIPAAGAVQGSSAFFRTSLQLMNPTTSTITGNLVFHKQLQSASPGDPSLAFTLSAGKTISYPDVIASMGTAGLGSLDIVTNGGDAPIATARVFSDGGSVIGTSGFSEEGVSPNDALDFFSGGILLIPADLTNFRMNIGVRTLDTGATLDVATFDASGSFVATRTVPYGANVFDQVPVSTFTGVSTVPPGGYIQIHFNVFGGRAFVYSSVIDNRTSDSTFRLADIR